VRMLQRWGYNVRYWERPGVGHTDAGSFDEVLSWFLSQRRVHPTHVRLRAVERLDTGDDAVFAHRCDWEDSTVVAVHNLAGREASAHLVLGVEGELVDLFEDEDHALDAGELTLELDPYGYRWFRVRRPGALLPP